VEVMEFKSLYKDKTVRRDRIQIYFDMITVASTPINATMIMQHANVQFNMFKESIENLLGVGFIEEIEIEGRPNSLYKSTMKGIEWTRKVDQVYTELENWTRE
jgi:predicted transcriptional regulator